MEDLFIWYCTSARRKKEVPQNENIWIRENFIFGNEIEGLNYDWLDYNYDEHGFPPNESLKLPKELYFIIQGQTSLKFDFLPYRKNMFIISERFKSFISNQLSNKKLEFSELKTVHKDNESFCCDMKYYLLRIITFDDDSFNFIEEGKKRAIGLRGEFIYPSLKLKENINQNLFFLSSFCYQEAMIFNEKTKNEIKSLFYSPEIYRISDFYLAFNNRMAESNSLPDTV